MATTGTHATVCRMAKRKTEGAKRGKAVHVRVSDWMYEALKAKAAADRRNVADYVRGLLLKDIEASAPEDWK